MQRFIQASPASITLALVCCVLLSQVGCNLFATMMYDGEHVPAAYSELEEKKVAVVCISGRSSFNEDSVSRDIATGVESMLTMNVDKIEIIPQQKIDDWKDRNGSETTEARLIGKDVGADMVIAIDLAQFELSNNPSMLKGNAKFSMAVYDMNQKGKLVYKQHSKSIIFPRNGSISTASQSEEEFRRNFVNLMVFKIARNFYKYNIHVEMNLDESYVSD
ncbi:MAG: hypothetical protein COA78_30165 [Blastopirellula sp.]|nr:MAG: hypothetical protein COA78_30165 [Blastopirellula sp.]